MKSKYSQNLRKVRKAAGITLQELSILSGRSLFSLQSYETRAEPKIGVYHDLMRICKDRIKENLKMADSL
jgi:transcriptional regulator with XRE-family HTH domain